MVYKWELTGISKPCAVALTFIAADHWCHYQRRYKAKDISASLPNLVQVYSVLVDSDIVVMAHIDMFVIYREMQTD